MNKIGNGRVASGIDRILFRAGVVISKLVIHFERFFFYSGQKFVVVFDIYGRNKCFRVSYVNIQP